jgi:FkbM family methyltransferase
VGWIPLSFPSKTINSFVSTPAGRTVFKVVQPIVHLARRMTNPDVPVRRTVARVSYRGKQFAIQLRRDSPADLLAVDQCFVQNQYDIPVGAHGVLIEHIYQEIVASGRLPLIIDCGANIGCSALWLHARYPMAHIVAIEPAPDNFELLRANCKNLDIDLIQAGVAATDGRARLSEAPGSEMGYRTIIDGNGPEVTMVAIGTLLEAKPASRYVPFLLKIDIEGAEKTLFSGDNAALAVFPLIIMEPHDWLFPGTLSSRGFFRFHVDAGREFCMRNENVASIALHSSLLGMTKDLKN